MHNNDYVQVLSGILHDNMLLTDVGSVKNRIHENIHQYPELEKHFIGGHPMCGTEHVGYEYSTPYMLENAFYILTPTETVPGFRVAEFEAFVKSIGALPMILPYKKHDFSVGSVSHLPTVIASTLVNLVKDLDDENETLRTIAAGGFKDITRVASSDPHHVGKYLRCQPDPDLRADRRVVKGPDKTRDTIARGSEEEIRRFFSSAKEYRDSFNISHKGVLHPV